MDSTSQSSHLFHVEIMQDIHLISCDLSGATGQIPSLAPGNPTGNSYLVVGQERALLFDLAADHPDIRNYAQQVAGKPVQLVLSHGHFDHVFHLSQFSEAWLHPADEYLIREGMMGMPPVNPCPILHPLLAGDTIDLGDRILDVINIAGHTPGSIMLLDRQTRTLLSGDTGARRLLFGSAGFVPLADFCKALNKLHNLEFDVMYSAHDRCALPKVHLARMAQLITEELPRTTKRWSYPGFAEMVWLVHGDPKCLDYFDMVCPVSYFDEVAENRPADLSHSL